MRVRHLKALVKILNFKDFYLYLAFFLPLTIFSQDYDKLAPKMPLSEKPDVQIEEEVLSKESQDLFPVIPTLKGLVFYGSIDQLRAEGVVYSGVDSSKLNWIDVPEFKELFSSYLGHPLSLNGLDKLVNQIVLVSRKVGRPVVDVFVPAQDVTSGTVQVIIFEGKIGEILIEGNKWFPEEKYRSKMRAKKGDYIRRGPLIEDIDWINENPFRKATVAFQRGKGNGESDIVVKVKDRNPLQVYNGFENNGNRLTDRGRLFGGFVWGNAFNLDQQIGVQATINPDYRRFKAVSGNYSIPLPWRHTLMLFGSWSKSSVEPEVDINVDAKSWQTGMRYQMNLKDYSRFRQNMQLGLDMKRSNNNLEFSGTSISNTYVDVVQSNASYQCTYNDSMGKTEFGMLYVFSPGEISKYNDNASFRSMREESQADYQYGRIDLERKTRVALGVTHRARISAQISDANLNSSEQFGLGGVTTIRGYEERTASGDKGYYVNNELIGPASMLGEIFNIQNDIGRLQPLLFWDYGKVSNQTTSNGANDGQILSSVGVGTRYNLKSTVMFNFDYGRQIRELPGSNDAGGRAHLYLVMYY
jgi:hemolysin activation/secretion protein